MKTITSIFVVAFGLFFSSTSLGGIALSRDSKTGCDLYRITTSEQPVSKGEKLISETQVSGFSMRNANVEFETKTVKMDVIAVVRLGFNGRPAGTTTWISPQQSNFRALLNSLNRTVFLYSKVCIAPTGQILWAE